MAQKEIVKGYPAPYLAVENPTPYEVIAEVEILSEIASGVCGDISRYSKEYCVDNSERNVFKELSSKLWQSKDNLLRCKTLEEVAVIEKFILNARAEVERLKYREQRAVG